MSPSIENTPSETISLPCSGFATASSCSRCSVSLWRNFFSWPNEGRNPSTSEAWLPRSENTMS